MTVHEKYLYQHPNSWTREISRGRIFVSGDLAGEFLLITAASPFRLRSSARRLLVRAADKVVRRFAYGRASAVFEDGVLTFNDYKYRPQPRFGVTREPLGWLDSQLRAQSDRMAESLDICQSCQEDLARISLEVTERSEDPHWLNPWLSGLDGAWLYSTVRHHAPARFIEIGSGNSTKFVRRAIRDGALLTQLVSIDPHPRAEINALCDSVYRAPLEAVDPSLFDVLSAGDILFFDGSHRALENSDVTVFFLEILPRVAPGVSVGIHDIFLPYDYPVDWTARLYNEQYMLAAYLLGRTGIHIDFAAYWMSTDGVFADKVEDLFRFDPGRLIQRHGGCFFFTT